MIHSAARRIAAVRTARMGRVFAGPPSYRCRTLSSRSNTADQPSAVRVGTGPGRVPAGYSSGSSNGSGRDGRSDPTTVSGTIVCRAQQAQSYTLNGAQAGR